MVNKLFYYSHYPINNPVNAAYHNFENYYRVWNSKQLCTEIHNKSFCLCPVRTHLFANGIRLD